MFWRILSISKLELLRVIHLNNSHLKKKGGSKPKGRSKPKGFHWLVSFCQKRLCYQDCLQIRWFWNLYWHDLVNRPLSVCERVSSQLPEISKPMRGHENHQCLRRLVELSGTSSAANTVSTGDASQKSELVHCIIQKIIKIRFYTFYPRPDVLRAKPIHVDFKILPVTNTLSIPFEHLHLLAPQFRLNMCDPENLWNALRQRFFVDNYNINCPECPGRA